jgi:protein-tyrosine phosphatase
MDILKSIYYVSNDKIINYLNRTNKKDTPERQRNDVLLTDKIYYFFSEPTHIIDNIYLGNGNNAANLSSLENNNIEVIINITSELENYYNDNSKFTYYKFSILDEKKNKISDYFNNFINTYNKHRDKNILIHCYMGASRSACLVLLYLIYEKKMSFEDANNFLKEKRTIVNINIEFISELKKFLNII